MTGSLIETPPLGDRTIADDRTRHHAPRARMDGWWTAAARTAPSPANLQPRGQLKTALTKPLQERRRNRQAEGLGGLEVEDQIELCRLLDGEVCRVGALENLVDVSGGAMPWPRSSVCDPPGHSRA